MLFNSFEFFVFFILVSVLYFTIPHRFRWLLLLTASCVFYMFFIPVYILILAFTIIIDYFAGILIEEAPPEKKKRWLVLSICANVGVLAFFKYYNFLNENLTEFLGLIHVQNPVPFLHIILPIGLSFHTFQAMSYTIEVYRGHKKTERHFGIYALYVMFYPQLVAGPIERPQNLLHQFYEKHYFDYQRVSDGLKLMAWGLFKKVVIADRLSLMVDHVYNDPQNHFGVPVILATTFFAFQTYCDFSGYSDIAIGSAKVMGFKLMKNFNRPFFATSMSEIWKRWHISLTSWFKDYVYVSMGGNRVPKWRWYVNLIVTFTLSGLWHGANWTYIIWGFLQGFYLAVGAATENIRSRFNSLFGNFRFTGLWTLWQRLVVFALFCTGLMFFRSSDLHAALTIIKHHFIFTNQDLSLTMMGANHYELILGISLIGFLLFIESMIGDLYIYEYFKSRPAAMRWVFFTILVLMILNLGVFNGSNFVYFQF